MLIYSIFFFSLSLVLGWSFREFPLVRVRTGLFMTPATAVADTIELWNSETRSTFVEKYWQKRPCLIRGMFFGEACVHPKIPTKDELLQLSMDDDVESRILVRAGGTKWIKEYGPFDKKYLRKYLRYNETDEIDAKGLPSQAWTVLVQEVDRHVPAMADLWAPFDFIPAWRRDDVMISYASPGGGIGAHVDNYDVFLLQGRGTREWSIENTFLTQDEERRREVPNIDTRLLRDFCNDQSFVLQPGDVLYLPPRVPHRGTAIGGGCTTVSLGFRAPSMRSMLTALTSHICETSLPEGLLYSDPDLAQQQRALPPSATSAVVSPQAVERIRAGLRSSVLAALDDNAAFEKWLGVYLTEPLRMQVRSPSPFFLRSSSSSPLRQAATEEEEEEEEEEEDEETELPLSITSPAHAVASKLEFSSAEEVIMAALDGRVQLRRAEGVRVVEVGGALFFNGEAFPIPSGSAIPFLVAVLTNGTRLVPTEQLRMALAQEEGRSSPVVRFCASLIRSGFFYPVDGANVSQKPSS